MKPVPAQARPDFVIFLLRQNSTVDNQLMQGYLGDIGWRISSAGKGFMPFLKKCPNRFKK